MQRAQRQLTVRGACNLGLRKAARCWTYRSDNDLGSDGRVLCPAALLNYETVAYFCNQDLERTNYATAINDYQVWILDMTSSHDRAACSPSTHLRLPCFGSDSCLAAPCFKIYAKSDA
jgi:hypothetical protein